MFYAFDLLVLAGEDVRRLPLEERRDRLRCQLMPKLGDQELLRSLGSQKAITIYTAAKSLNVSASIARMILGSLESKGMLFKVGGYSGHYVWAPSLTSRT